MKEEDARESACNIIDLLEDLLADRGILIPSADREGREEEACIYGTEYYPLEDAVVEILKNSHRRLDTVQGSRKVASLILEEFKETLEYHRISIPRDTPGEASGDEAIPAEEYGRLSDGIVRLLLREGRKAGILAVKTRWV